MRIGFSGRLRDPSTNAALGPDIDVELEARAELDGGDPIVIVESILLDGDVGPDGTRPVVDLLASADPVLNGFGRQLQAEAAIDDRVFAAAIQDAGISYRGLGGNDPDGRWLQNNPDPDAAYEAARDAERA